MIDNFLTTNWAIVIDSWYDDFLLQDFLNFEVKMNISAIVFQEVLHLEVSNNS